MQEKLLSIRSNNFTYTPIRIGIDSEDLDRPKYALMILFHCCANAKLPLNDRFTFCYDHFWLGRKLLDIHGVSSNALHFKLIKLKPVDLWVCVVKKHFKTQTSTNWVNDRVPMG